MQAGDIKKISGIF